MWLILTPVLHSWPFRGLPLSSYHSDTSQSCLVAFLRYSLSSGKFREDKSLALALRLEMSATRQMDYRKIVNCLGVEDNDFPLF